MASPNVKVTIGDVEHDQHFSIQESASHPVILGEPYITASWMETRYLIMVPHMRGYEVKMGQARFNSSQYDRTMKGIGIA